MAITSAEIHNQSFSIDRKGYDVDEVDVFLEHVADEIDGMNAVSYTHLTLPTNTQAAATIKDAEDEGTRIVDKAEAERQKVLDAIKKLEDDREDVREDYRDLLTDFIGDATRKLAEIGGEMPASLPVSAHARTIDVVETTATGRVTAPAQAPINRDGAGAYSVPQATGAVVAPATPTPSGVEKDLSGFGDADDAFEFEEID